MFAESIPSWDQIWNFSHTLVKVLIMLVFLKAIIIGSDYSPYNHIKYGKRYWNYYSNRPGFKPDTIYRDKD